MSLLSSQHSDGVTEKKIGGGGGGGDNVHVHDKGTSLPATGILQYVAESGGNDAPSTYQIATGAPVEDHSPLGYNVGPVTIIFLNISMMIGTGVYSTRKLFQSCPRPLPPIYPAVHSLTLR